MPKIVLLLCGLACAIVGATAPLALSSLALIESDSSGFIQWLPERSPAKKEYDRFVDQFGIDDYLLISWPGCTLGDARTAEMIASLESLAESEDALRDGLVQRVLSGPQLVDALCGPPLDLPRADAVERLKGVLVGNDGETTAILVSPTIQGQERQMDVIAAVRDSAAAAGVDVRTLRLGGPIREGTAMQDEMQRTLHGYVFYIFVATFLVTLLFLRDLGQITIIISVAFYCRCLSMALVLYTGHKLSIVLSVMPVLVYVLAVSGGVHLVNYFRDAVRDGKPHAGWATLQAGWLPCTLAAATTAIGMLSLCISEIKPVRDFGTYAAVSMLITLLVLLGCVPVALQADAWLRQKIWPTRPQGKKSDTVWLSRLADGVISSHKLIAVLSSAVVVTALAWLPSLTTSVNIERMFSRSSPLVRDYQWIEQNVSSIATVEFVLTFLPDNELAPSTRTRLLRQLEERLREHSEVDGVLSTASFLPGLLSDASVRSVVRRTVFDRKLRSQRQPLVDRGYLALEGDSESWRLTARVSALADLEYSELVRRLASTAESVLADGDFQDVNVHVTGVLPMMDAAQKQVLQDLKSSLLLAAALICPVMMLLLCSIRSGLLAMIPNLFPIVAVFGAISWIQKPVDVGTMLTACVALGIAVDDTLHFLTWFGRGLKEQRGVPGSVRHAFQRCATAMIQTTFICGLGLLPVTMQDFIPTREFALMLLTILAVALVGDLVMLPAILVGPLGRLCIKVPPRGKTSDRRTGRFSPIVAP